MSSNKDQRRLIFNDALDAAGVPKWGRGAAISKACGCSPASAQAWIRGSLPSEGERIVELCDLYSIDLYLWVTLKSRGVLAVPKSDLISGIAAVKDFTDRSNVDITPEQFAKLSVVCSDRNKRSNLDEVFNILINS